MTKITFTCPNTKSLDKYFILYFQFVYLPANTIVTLPLMTLLTVEWIVIKEILLSP